jgi:localization factor PodJL
MSAGAPWSVKGIDPKAREIAKDLARRSGMTLGEWLNQMILEGDGEEDQVIPFGRKAAQAADYRGPDRRGRVRRIEDAYADREPHQDNETAQLARVTDALEALSARLESAEHRTTLAIGGVDQAVSGLLARLETTEREQLAASERLEHVTEDLRDSQGRMLDRIREVEHENRTPRSAEALRALEGALGKIAGQVLDADARTRAAIGETREDLTSLARRIDRTESRQPEPDGARLVDGVVARIAERLEQAEARTSGAIRTLESSLSHLDERLRGAETRIDADRETRFDKLAADLSQRVEEARSELVRRFDAAAENRFDQVDRGLAELTTHVQAAEQRSASAIERMGHEVLRIAQNLNRRMTGVERSSATAVERVGGEMARVANAVEDRLRKADDQQVQALERLGQEIARISEKLNERITNAERRTAMTADDVGERVGRVADKLEARYERASSEIAERIRQSEERTARLLAEAQQTIDRGLARAEERPPAPPPVAPPSAPPSAPIETQLREPDEPAFPHPAFPQLAAPESASANDIDALFEPDAPFAGFVPQNTPKARPAPIAHEPLAFTAPQPAPFAPQPAAVAPAYAPSPTAFAPQPGAFAPAALPAPPPDNAFDEAFFAPPASKALPAPAGHDEFAGETEFMSPQEVRAARPAVSTKEAIEAARAAARLGVRNSSGDQPLFGNLKGKGRLNERIQKEKQRQGSTVKTALLASSFATIVACSAVGYWLLARDGASPEHKAGGLKILAGDLFNSGSDNDHAPLAAMAISPTPAAPQTGGGDQAQAETLYQTAVSHIADGNAQGVNELSRAANLGYAPAQFFLASLYTTGESGVRKDPNEARRWTERAALGGDSRAMFNLGMFFFEGTGGPKDEAEAANWFRKAAELGLVDSQYNLARLYEQGLGVKRDPAEAYKWYLIAGRSGDEPSKDGAQRIRGLLDQGKRERAEQTAAAFKAPDAKPQSTTPAAPTDE